MVRKRDYSGVYSRIEAALDIEDLVPEAITAYLTEGRVGAHKIKYGKTKKGTQRYVQSQGISSSGLTGIQKFAQDVALAGDLYSQAKEAYSTITIGQIQRQARTVVVHQKSLSGFLEERFNDLQFQEQIQEQISVFREQVDEIRTLSVEEQKELFKSGTIEERKLAGVALRETSPQVLGGLISGERRRVGRAIRVVFL